MKQPCYISLNQAQQVLSDMGVELNGRQMKRAAEPDRSGAYSGEGEHPYWFMMNTTTA
jgi:hypothetical protein